MTPTSVIPSEAACEALRGEVEESLESFPSDIVPGIAPVAIDYDWALREIERLQAKLDALKPFVVRVGGNFVLYQGKEIRVETPDAQLMQDYLNNTLPVGMKIKWFVLPADQPLNPS